MQRVAVITGASSGIGREASIELARRGWRVAVVGRNPERTEDVARVVGGDAYVADFDQLAQVQELATRLTKTLPRIDVLINNAGGILAKRQVSPDGFELTLQRNVLGSIVLTEALVPALQVHSGRVVHTSSLMNRIARLRIDDLDYHRRSFGRGWQPYADAKLGVILYAKSLANRTGLGSYSVHPGYVRTGFGAELPTATWSARLTRRFQISPQAGAAPLVHIADTPELGVENGSYFDGLLPHGKTHPLAGRPATVQAYWEACASRVG